MFFDVKLFRSFIYSDYFCTQIQIQIYKQLFKQYPKIKINSKTTFAELIINMTHLSVNINKIATLRNARGENNPNVVQVAIDCESFGAQGITVHPRPDERHIRRTDVYDLRAIVKTEFNIEGNPTPEFIDLVLRVRPEQVTLVPDAANVLTSCGGWNVEANFDFLTETVERFRDAGIRTSIFVDTDLDTIRLAAKNRSRPR